MKTPPLHRLALAAFLFAFVHASASADPTDLNPSVAATLDSQDVAWDSPSADLRSRPASEKMTKIMALSMHFIG